MSEDGYCGWVNKETWALALHLGNDEGLYAECVRRVEESKNPARAIEEFVEELRDECRSGGNEVLLNMFDDVGSVWRVDFGSVADCFKEE